MRQFKHELRQQPDSPRNRERIIAIDKKIAESESRLHQLNSNLNETQRITCAITIMLQNTKKKV